MYSIIQVLMDLLYMYQSASAFLHHYSTFCGTSYLKVCYLMVLLLTILFCTLVNIPVLALPFCRLCYWIYHPLLFIIGSRVWLNDLSLWLSVQLSSKVTFECTWNMFGTHPEYIRICGSTKRRDKVAAITTPFTYRVTKKWSCVK